MASPRYWSARTSPLTRISSGRSRTAIRVTSRATASALCSQESSARCWYRRWDQPPGALLRISSSCPSAVRTTSARSRATPIRSAPVRSTSTIMWGSRVCRHRSSGTSRGNGAHAATSVERASGPCSTCRIPSARLATTARHAPSRWASGTNGSIASRIDGGAPCDASSRRRSFHRSSERCAAFSIPASVVRYTETNGPHAFVSATRSSATTAPPGTAREPSMPQTFPPRRPT